MKVFKDWVMHKVKGLWMLFEETHKSKKEGTDQESIQSSPHLTQDTNWKMITSQLDITNESQEVSPFQAGGHKAPINRRARNSITKTRQKNVI